MKLTLLVTTPSSRRGQEVTVARSTFTIGRDPECQLRPASELVSRRHCELRTRDGRVFLHDIQSTNGTFVNDQPVNGVAELRHGDRLRVGPLEFEVCVQADTPGPLSDDEVAAILMSPDGNDPTPGAIPTGETAPATPAVPLPTTEPAKHAGDAATAAKSLLTTYRRRPR